VKRNLLLCALLLSLGPGVCVAQVPHAGHGIGQWYPYPPVLVAIPPVGYQGQVATVRTDVVPKETLVFVDGYPAGVADDFDGIFHRLQLMPGQHEITLYLAGYKTYRENLYLSPSAGHSVRHTMERRSAGEPDDPEPVPMIRQTHPMGPPYDSRAGGVAVTSSRYGTLSLQVQPEAASVFIDGGPFSLVHQAGLTESLVVQLPEGRHDLHVEKPGFDNYSTTVVVTAGETTDLNVSLLRGR